MIIDHEAVSDRDLMVLKLHMFDCAKDMAITQLSAKLRQLGGEAHKEGKNLAVGPLYPQQIEDRPTIDGHFVKFKFDYRFLEPDDPWSQVDWVVFNTSEVDPTIPLTSVK